MQIIWAIKKVDKGYRKLYTGGDKLLVTREK